MSILVKHKYDENLYVLLGAGLAEYKSSRPGAVMGALNPVEEHGRSAMLAVCDEDGRIHWFDSAELYVVTVDGRPPCDVIGQCDIPQSEDVPLTIDGQQASSDEIDAFLSED